MTVAPSCGSWVNNVLLVALLAPRMLTWLQDFWKICAVHPWLIGWWRVVTERWTVTRGIAISNWSYVSGSFSWMRIHLITRRMSGLSVSCLWCQMACHGKVTLTALTELPRLARCCRRLAGCYRIFSNLIRTLFTVSEGLKIRCGLDSRSWAGFWKNGRAAVRAVRTIQ